MSKRWSKLQIRLYNIIDPSVDFSIHMALYEMNSNDGYHGNKLPRYWITVGGKIVFDYPKLFDVPQYPWCTDISDISELIDEYICTPKDQLDMIYAKDKWGITDIIRACDRRIGKRRLKKMLESEDDPVIISIIEKRLFASDTKV